MIFLFLFGGDFSGAPPVNFSGEPVGWVKSPTKSTTRWKPVMNGVTWGPYRWGETSPQLYPFIRPNHFCLIM